MSEIQYGGRQTGTTYISGSTLDSSEIPKVITHVSMNNRCNCMHLDVVCVSGICRIQYGSHQTGSSCNLSCIVARNVIPEATTRFSGVAIKMQHRPIGPKL